MAVMQYKTSVKMTKKNRLAILKRARKLITDPAHWTTGRLRRKVRGKDEYQYCVLGAVEQAAYELKLLEPDGRPFKNDEDEGIGFLLGEDISLFTFSEQRYGYAPYSVNDLNGHGDALQLLDEYIVEVEKGKAREPKGD